MPPAACRPCSRPAARSSPLSVMPSWRGPRKGPLFLWREQGRDAVLTGRRIPEPLRWRSPRGGLRARLRSPRCAGSKGFSWTPDRRGKARDAQGTEVCPRSVAWAGGKSRGGYRGAIKAPPADAASAFRADGGPPCGAPARGPVCIKYFIKFPWLPFVVLFSRQPEERPRPRQPPRPRKKGN